VPVIELRGAFGAVISSGTADVPMNRHRLHADLTPTFLGWLLSLFGAPK
jgi:hypothetical protein